MAGNRSLGNLTVDLILRSQGWAEGWTKAERDADKAQRALSRKAKETAREVGDAWNKAAGVIGAGIAGITVGTVFTEINRVTKETAQLATEYERLSVLSNTSAENFQRLAAGAKTAGVSAEKLADIFKDVQDKAGDFAQTGGGGMADFFEKIAPKVGVTIDQFRRLSGPEALQLYVSSLEKANLSQQDMVFYMEAVASDSALLLPLLRDNGAEFARLGQAAQDAGAIMSGQALAAAKAYKEETDALERTMQGLRIEIMERGLPALTEFNRLLGDPNTVDTIRGVVTALTDLTRGVSEFASVVNASSFWGWLQVGAEDSKDLDASIAETEQKIASLEKSVASMSRPLFRYFEADNIAIANGQISTLQAKLETLYATRDRAEARVTAELERIGRIGLDAYPSAAPSALSPVTVKPKSTGKSQAEKDAEAAEKYLAAMRDQYAAVKDLSAVQKLDYDLQAGKVKLTAAQTAQAREYAEAVDRRVAAEKAAAEFAKEVARVNDELNRNDELREEIALIGLESEQIASINRQRVEAALLVKQQHAAELDRLATADAGWSRERANLQTEIDLLEERLELMDSRQARTKIAESWKDQEEQGQRAMESIVNSYTDGLINGTQSFAQLLENTVFTVLVRPVVEGTVGGLLGGGNSSGAAGIANSLQSLYSLGTSPLLQNFGLAAAGNIQQIGGTLFSKGFESMGSGIVDFGNTVAQFSDAINLAGDVFGYGSAIYGLSQGKFGSAAGAAIGTWFGGPVGSIIGSTLGGLVDGMFGGSPYYGGDAVSVGGAAPWTGKMGGGYDSGVGNYFGSYAQGISAAMTGLLEDEIHVKIGFDENEKRARAYLDLYDTAGNIAVTRSGVSVAKGEQGAKEAVDLVAKEAFTALLADDRLATYEKQLIAAASAAGATYENLISAYTQIEQINAAFDALGKTMAVFADMTDEMKTALLGGLGGIEGFAAAAQTYYESYYSEQERMLTARQQQMDAMAAMGVSIDPAQGEQAKAAFRSTVEQAMAAGNEELAVQLLSVSGAFLSVADAAQKAADSAAAARLEIAQGLYDQAMANLEAAIDREKTYWQKVAGAAQEAIASLSGVLSALTSASRELYGSVPDVSEMMAQQGALYIREALSAVRGGASVLDFGQLETAIASVSGGLDSGGFATQFERDVAALETAASLSELGKLTGNELSVQERQLKAAETQIEQLDAYWQQALGNDQTQIDATLSVAEAVAALGPILASLRDAQASSFGSAIQSASGATPEEKAALYREMLASGLTDAQVRAQVEKVSGAQTQTDWDWLRRLAGVASFDVGTNYVQEDMLAMVHKGEMIVPRAYNPNADGVNQTPSLLSQIRDDARVHAGAVVRLLTAMNRRGNAWDVDGLPPTREEILP